MNALTGQRYLSCKTRSRVWLSLLSTRRVAQLAKSGAVQLRRRGAVATEMAITLPILFLFVFAALEFCGLNNLRHTADNAAYEAARLGTLPGSTTADVIDEATTIMSFVGAANVNVVVDPDPIDPDAEEITVTVSVPLAGNGWMTPMILDSSSIITGQCSMLREEY